MPKLPTVVYFTNKEQYHVLFKKQLTLIYRIRNPIVVLEKGELRIDSWIITGYCLFERQLISEAKCLILPTDRK